MTCIKPDSLRGHAIYFDGREFRFSDNHQSTVETWKDRPCGHCGLNNTPEGHDGCLGTLPGVSNACCGHGVDRAAYIQYTDGTEVRGIEVFEEVRQMKRHERHMLGIALIIIFVAVVGLVQLIMEKM